MKQQTILTGLRANNDLHIGNYFGGLLPIITMANKHAGDYQINLFIPDLHSFTTPIDHSQLQDQISQSIRIFAAAGIPLNNPDVNIYRQSYVPAHSELTWILDCFTGYGEMSRMTQFKDKSAQLQTERVSLGLFNYPVLMAADILLYNASYVPVGDDQSQHLEFTRDIAQRLNTRFETDIFTIPEPVKAQHEFFGRDHGLRINDLSDPTKKMSKSDETGKGVIFLTDAPQQAHKKVMSATTDSLSEIKYDPIERPGISNLIDLLSLLRNQPVAEIIQQYTGQTAYGPFKGEVADEVATFLEQFQQSMATVDDQAVSDALQRSEAKMNQVASETLLRVQIAVGLR